MRRCSPRPPPRIPALSPKLGELLHGLPYGWRRQLHASVFIRSVALHEHNAAVSRLGHLLVFLLYDYGGVYGDVVAQVSNRLQKLQRAGVPVYKRPVYVDPPKLLHHVHPGVGGVDVHHQVQLPGSFQKDAEVLPLFVEAVGDESLVQPDLPYALHLGAFNQFQNGLEVAWLRLLYLPGVDA